MDKIKLNQLQFYGYHGLLPEENKLGQRFFVDAELSVSLKKAGETDDMNDSIDYGKAFEVIQAVVEGEAKNLIETVASEVAAVLLKTFSKLEACRIQLIKPDPPVHGQYQSVAVEIYRERGE